MIEAVSLHGPVQGFWIGMKRIGRCHPGSDGGIDPVPGSELEMSYQQELAEEAAKCGCGASKEQP